MENIASWTPVHKAIHEAITEWDNEQEGVCGLSLVARIYNILYFSGYLNEHCTRPDPPKE